MTALTHTIRSTDFHTLVVVAAPDSEYTAHLEAGEDGQRVIIARDGALAGEGHWTGQRIENCAAVLAEPDESGRGRDQDASEAVYEALEAGLREMVLSSRTVVAVDGRDYEAVPATAEAIKRLEDRWGREAFPVLAARRGSAMIVRLVTPLTVEEMASDEAERSMRLREDEGAICRRPDGSIDPAPPRAGKIVLSPGACTVQAAFRAAGVPAYFTITTMSGEEAQYSHIAVVAAVNESIADHDRRCEARTAAIAAVEADAVGREQSTIIVEALADLAELIGQCWHAMGARRDDVQRFADRVGRLRRAPPS